MSRILVIDDDEQVRKIALRMLAHAGHDVREAPDGKAGLQMYKQDRPDVVISDVMMPVMEGLETIRALRKVDAQVRIIAMTGAIKDRAASYLETAKVFGALEILQKPFTRDELLAAVAKVLSHGSGSQ